MCSSGATWPESAGPTSRSSPASLTAAGCAARASPATSGAASLRLVGEGVLDVAGVTAVVCESYCYCGACPRCRGPVTRTSASTTTASGSPRGGGYGELVLVPRRVVHQLPEERPARRRRTDRAGLGRAEGLAGARRPQLRESIGVIGVGTLGALAIVLARLWGGRAQVVAFGCATPSSSLRGASAATETVDVSVR